MQPFWRPGVELAAYDVCVNVVFLGDAEFDPPPPLGTEEESQSPELRRWIEQAGRGKGWR